MIRQENRVVCNALVGLDLLTLAARTFTTFLAMFLAARGDLVEQLASVDGADVGALKTAVSGPDREKEDRQHGGESRMSGQAGRTT